MSKEKQLEIIADICPFYKEYGSCERCNAELDIGDQPCDYECIAITIFNFGYRKQSKGEWEELMHFNFEGGYSGSTYRCSNCQYDDCYEETAYCPNCGAKMKGGAE